MKTNLLKILLKTFSCFHSSSLCSTIANNPALYLRFQLRSHTMKSLKALQMR